MKGRKGKVLIVPLLLDGVIWACLIYSGAVAGKHGLPIATIACLVALVLHCARDKGYE